MDTTTNTAFRRNIIALYLIKISKWFTLVMPIIVLFYTECGISVADVFVLKSAYSIAMLALDIPAGYLADVWGRRRCLIVGCMACFIGSLVYTGAATFPFFLLAEILLGAGQSLVSGADSALLYDTTLHHRRADDYLKYEGRVTMIGNFSEAIAGIFGGLLAAASLRFPFYAQAVVAFIGIPAALALTEHAAPVRSRNSFAALLKIIRYSLFENRALCCNIMFSGVIGAATLTMAWFVQPFLIELDTPTSWFGVIWTVLNLTVGIAALCSDKLDRLLGTHRMYAFILLFIAGGYVALSFSLTTAGLAILLLFYIVRGFATPILKGYINQITFSEMRATVLSIRNFVIRVIFAAIAPLVGWLHDAYSLTTALQATALIIFLPGLLFLILELTAKPRP